ncbi:S1 family peptidase [Streptomyces aureocirculatus]|uniref:S1 family peptidase n=1 Tax=Streptomyces aureocirculatus TaxID=67275 RepID=UPI0004C59323|nr:serine protease [Streptomyces aureocirculatus]
MTCCGPYWVDLHRAGQRLGGGFLLTNWLVLTALHCLRGLVQVDDHVDVVLADGRRLDAHVSRLDPEADLALIGITPPQRATPRIPNSGPARIGGRWRGPYRPAANEVELSGRIDTRAASYLSEGGGTIEALQLSADQFLGDYSGYSGGPVEDTTSCDNHTPEHTADKQHPVVVGILLEQAPDRIAADRAANVLFAATIAEAMRRFNHLGVAHLVDVLRPPAEARTATEDTEPPPAPRGATAVVAGAPPNPMVAAADALLEEIDAEAARGIMNAAQTADLRFQVWRHKISATFGEDGAP